MITLSLLIYFWFNFCYFKLATLVLFSIQFVNNFIKFCIIFKANYCFLLIIISFR